MFKQRASGVLMHISSLPSPYGIGDLGPDASRFIDFLHASGQSYWQILPVTPTQGSTGYSPYNCYSAFAGNPMLISPHQLVCRGYLAQSDLVDLPALPHSYVDFRKAERLKTRLLKKAYKSFSDKKAPEAYTRFCAQHQSWLDDFSLFCVLAKKLNYSSWSDWPGALRDRQKKALRDACRRYDQEIDYECFCQFCFYNQYADLRTYANQLGISIIGDLPFYVAYESADVWSHPGLFKLDRSKKPRFISGVPPDYFSRTGQLWGNPVYNWPKLKKNGYAWFVNRIAHNLGFFDLLRIDHFRAFSAYWEVPAHHKTAAKGKWIDGPQEPFFRALYNKIPFAAIFAEDLGHITPDVKQLIHRFSLSGMHVLQFGFDGEPSTNTHSLYNHKNNGVVYTGTHDNNTTRGWFDNEITPDQHTRLRQITGHRPSSRTVSWDMIRLAMLSVSDLAIIPMQDLLNLDTKARMNRPATPDGNWKWRMQGRCIHPKLTSRLHELTDVTGR
jgi:4-alpha-glucanotransferase